MDDGDIIKALELNINRRGYYDSELSRERKKVTEYYNAELPKPAHDGNRSSYHRTLRWRTINDSVT